MRALPKNLGRLLLLILLAASGPVACAEDERPNILFIAVDDLKPLAGVYGSDGIQTPHIDALASKGLVFTRAYTQYPVCGPSRASLLTGLRPEANGVMDLKTRMRDIHPDILTLPQHFKNNGYETAAVGKIFDPRNVDSRKDEDPASWSVPFQQTIGAVDLKDPDKLAVRSIDAATDQFVDGRINKRGVSLLKQMAKGDKPFFLGVGYKKPHLPFTVPKRFFDLYDRNEFALADFTRAPTDSNATYILNNNGELRGYAPTPAEGAPAVRYADGVLPADQQRELLHGYYAATSFIDNLVGELMAALEASGEADDTVIVLWGDHGFHLGDHGLWGKHTTMEQATRVPLLLISPRGGHGKVSDPVELLDLFPTLTALAGIETPEGLQGESLARYLVEPGLEREAVAISQYKRKGAYGYSLRSNRYRYTEWVNKDGRTIYRDLYDMEADPGETRNIATDKENDALIERMARLLRENGDGLVRLQD